MPQAGPLVWIVLGASLFGAGLRVMAPPLSWLALILLLRGSRSTTVSRAAAWLFVGFYAAVAVGNHGIIPISGPAYFVVAGFLAFTLTGPFVVDRIAPLGPERLGSTLIFPMAFVTVELLRSRLAPGATWGSIAYTQYGCLALLQAAAFAGLAGITFVMAWFASTFEMAWRRGFDWTAVRTPVLTCGAVTGAVLLGGSLRLALAPTGRATTRVAAVNRPTDLFVPGEMTRISEGSVSPAERQHVTAKLARLHDWFLESSRREARAGARLIVWPEQNLLIFKEEEKEFLERAQQLAASEKAYLAMGMGTIHLGDKLPFENKLVLIDPSGKILLSYEKTHPVMGWEERILKRGDGRLPVVSTAAGRMAGAICYDADFPEFIRQAGQRSADVLIVPANDWKQIKRLHTQMAAFRAIENGVPVVRAAASGVSAAFDPWDRSLGEADYFAPGDRTLTAQVPLGGVPTLYTRTGDFFGWVCVAGLVLALGGAAMNSRKPASNGAGGGLLIDPTNRNGHLNETWLTRYPSFQSRRHSGPRKRRAAVWSLSAIAVLGACLFGAMGLRFVVRGAGRFLHRAVEQQFNRAAQIPASYQPRR